ncbi:Myb/SANT-like DNA-binding domain-containing protein [Mycena sp. CBHHK59/15]|nr:Myb/SANT-like DNA-binding domain-containing protein [Mycena sp. CBHHK59/15]
MPKSSASKDTSSDPENAHGGSKKGRTRDVWKAFQLAILVHVFVEEKNKGRQSESGWDKEAYQKVSDTLKAAGTIRSVAQVKSCWTRTKGQYKIIKGMLELSGFGFDASTKCVTATKEVWGAYLAASSFPFTFAYTQHPKHRPFKDRTFVHYDDMAMLCDDVMATGEDAFSNGATGGNQDLSIGSDDNNNASGSVGGGDEGDDENEEEDDEEGRKGCLGIYLYARSISAFDRS